MEKAKKCKLHCYNKKYGTAYKDDRIKSKYPQSMPDVRLI